MPIQTKGAISIAPDTKLQVHADSNVKTVCVITTGTSGFSCKMPSLEKGIVRGLQKTKSRKGETNIVLTITVISQMILEGTAP